MDSNRSDNDKKAEDLLAVLRRQTNGAVVEAMEARGAAWPVNYGVSVTAVRAAACRYAGDHELAHVLYTRPERELRLAAIYVADPAKVTPIELDFWKDGILNGESAEHLSILLGRSPVVVDALKRWFAAGDSAAYAALLGAARLITAGNLASADAQELLQLLPSILEAAGGADRLVGSGIITLLAALWNHRSELRSTLRPALEVLKAHHPDIYDQLSWQLE